jgi:phosphotransferase system enzyme I (PtsI)
VILDGTSGILIVNPTPSQIKTYRDRRQTEALEDKELQALAAADSVTLDGHWVTLRANVDLPEEAEFAAHSGAEGVGLMRTEFLVVGRATMPDEEEQYRAYRHVVEAFGGRPVVIRTFDVGGDKLPIGSYPTDPNPFLGWRAIRMCLDEPELFKTQLRALLRAAMHGDVRIMFPLIITLDEVKQAKHLLNEAAGELDARGVPYRHDLPLGVMVETPAAALSVHTLVDDVSFLSIGTNDLVQYTLAVDRGSANLASRFTPLHPAVLTLIKRIVDVGVAHRLEVAVCGEMASQPLMAFALIGLGVRCLSVAGRAVPLVKRIVRGVSVAVAAEAANAALESRTAREAEGELRRRLMTAFGDAPFLREGLPTFDDGNIFEGSGGLKTSSAHE